jgi:glutathione synthase
MATSPRPADAFHYCPELTSSVLRGRIRRSTSPTLHGHGGAAVFRILPQDMNFGSLYDMFSVTFREPWVIQRFLAEVKHGDKRIILVDGEFAGAVNRVPADDDLRSNMVRGGAAQATDLTPREREICARLGPALPERGLLFVGIDVIDGNLTEINVTSPTGIRAIARLGGPDVAAMIWNAIGPSENNARVQPPVVP